jgi:hypothetical protein
MLFDDIKVDTTIHNNELYVNVEQLHQHLTGSTELFSQEAYEMSKKFGITRDEKYFVQGLVQGMWSVVMMLKFGNQEHEFESVQTVDDLLERFWNDNRTDD